MQLAELWLEANVQVAEPTDEELRFLLERDRARYISPATVAFTHVFFASSREHAAEDAANAATQIAEADTPAALGDPFLLGATLPARTRSELAGSYGEAFAEAVFEVEARIWSTPIQSSYGIHVVYVTARHDAHIPALNEVRARVRSDWMTERTQTEVRRALARVRAAYVVER